MTEPTVLLESKEATATIIFNRPTLMNSFNRQMAEELADITEQVKHNMGIRAVLLKGAGNLFMAGGDIRFFQENMATMPACVSEIVEILSISIKNLMQMEKPVIASVHGSVAGVGMSFMLACDVVIAADNTKFTTAYSGLGACADGGMTFMLPRHLGLKKATELLFLAEVFDAATALQLGLINYAVPAEKLAEETVRLLHKLANGPTQSYIQIKKLLQQTWHNDLSTHLQAEGKGFAACSITQDFKEGVSAFLQKRKPQFIGK